MDKQLVECFKALGDPIRFKIYTRLKHGTVCACDFLGELDLEISQPTLSFHLKKLTQCGLISEEKDGIRKNFSVNREVLELMQKYLNETKEEEK